MSDSVEDQSKRSLEVEKYYGKVSRQPISGEKTPMTLTRLGIQGRFAWPISTYLKMQGKGLSAREWGREIFKALSQSEIYGDPEKVEKQIRNLFVDTPRPYPSIEIADNIIDALLNILESVDPTLKAREVKKELISSTIKTPGQSLQRLFALNKKNDPSLWSELKDYLHLDFKTGLEPGRQPVTTRPSEVIATQIRNNLTENNDQFHVVWGGKYSGKASVLKSLFHQLTSVDSVKDNPESTPRHRLAIFAITDQHETYRDILIKVYIFLTENKTPEEKKAAKHVRPDLIKEASIPSLLKEIESVAMTPAIYLFATPGIYDRHSIERTVQDDGFRRLANILLNGSNHTRIIATSSSDPKKAITSVAEINNPIIYEVERPKLNDLKSFTTPRIWNKFQDLIDDRNLTENVMEREIDGRYLQLLVTYLAAKSTVDSDIVNAVLNFTQKDNVATESGKDKVKTIEAIKTDFICDTIESLFNLRDGMEKKILLLLLASDDGLVMSSLMQMLNKWSVLENNSRPKIQDVQNFLKDMNEDTNSRFLSTSKETRLSENEITYDELKNMVSGEATNGTFTIDKPMRQLIAQHLLRTDLPRNNTAISKQLRREFRIANLMVASFALKRALLIKENSDQKYGSTLAQLKRSFQAIIGGLSAINDKEFFDEKNPQKPENNELILNLKNPINCNRLDDYTQANQIFLYLFRYVFRLEVDYDNRLTTSLDEDTVRLETLMSFWGGIGKRFYLQDIDDKFTLGEIPKHIESWLLPDEICYLILSICVAAHHANYPKICFESAALLKSYKNRLALELETSKEQEDASVQRTHRSNLERATFNWVYAECHVVGTRLLRVDNHYSSIHSGKNEGQTSNVKLKDIWLSAFHYLKKIEEDIKSSLEDRVLRLIAIRQILHKRLQISQALDMPLETTLELLNAHSDLQKELSLQPPSSTRNHISFFSQHFTESLIGDCFFDDVRRPSNIINVFDSKLKDIFEETIIMQSSRLSRYLGSERLALLTTSAWYHLRKGKLGDANDKIQSAKAKASATDISYAMRASIDWAAAQIGFRQHITYESNTDTLQRVREILLALYTYTDKAKLSKYKYRASLLWSAVVIENEVNDHNITQDDDEIANTIAAVDDILARRDEIAEPCLIRKAEQIKERLEEVFPSRS